MFPIIEERPAVLQKYKRKYTLWVKSIIGRKTNKILFRQKLFIEHTKGYLHPHHTWFDMPRKSFLCTSSKERFPSAIISMGRNSMHGSECLLYLTCWYNMYNAHPYPGETCLKPWFHQRPIFGLKWPSCSKWDILAQILCVDGRVCVVYLMK